MMCDELASIVAAINFSGSFTWSPGKNIGLMARSSPSTDLALPTDNIFVALFSKSQ